MSFGRGRVSPVKRAIAGTALVAMAAAAAAAWGQTGPAASLPPGYWPHDRSQALLARTQTVLLEADLSRLTDGERAAVAKLLDVGRIFQDLYERQRHQQAPAAQRQLGMLHEKLQRPPATANLLTLYRLFQGPVATTLDNRREPFLPVEPPPPGPAVYPWGIARQEIDDFIARHPAQRRSLLDARTVVRRATAENLERDRRTLAAHPVLATLHPGLAQRLAGLGRQPGQGALYGVPYSVAYAEDLLRAFTLLNEAAEAVEADDPEFAGYLRNRARDLLSDDYESGDAAWVTARFGSLNAQIGAYEVYDDALFGVKTFFGLSLLVSRASETSQLRSALRGLQALEESLPYTQQKKVKDDIPIGVYDVVADFGQARGGNTATILPNEAYLARRYGRTILLRSNILRSPAIFETTQPAWSAALAEPHQDELTSDGNLFRTIWHEIGHYLGVDRTAGGQELDAALQESASLLEEMKADLVALFLARALRTRGYYSEPQLRAVYASGINRVLQPVRPRAEQAYNTMQLMQWNFFLENGVLEFNRSTGRLRIHYDRYHDAVTKLLARVLEVQQAGDRTAALGFVERYTAWDAALHEVVAANIRERQQVRFRLFRYAALE